MAMYNPNFYQPNYYPQTGYQNYQNQQNVYQPNYGQAQQMPQQATQAPQSNENGIRWVQGSEGAKAYLVSPGSSVMLMDSERNMFYIKSSDNSGIPNMRSFEYKEVTNASQPPTSLPTESDFSEKFVTREEYKKICEEHEKIVNVLTQLSEKINKTEVNVNAESAL